MSREDVTATNATHYIAVPPEARAFQGHRAGVVTRTAANVVDGAVGISAVLGLYVAWCAVRFLTGPAAFTFPAPPKAAVFSCWGVVLFCYFTASWATTGQTYGDHLLGLRVVNIHGRRMRWPGAAARSALCVAVPIGLYWAIVSPTNRSLQDTLLRSSVHYDWTSRRPEPDPPTAATAPAQRVPGPRPPGADADPAPIEPPQNPTRSDQSPQAP